MMIRTSRVMMSSASATSSSSSSSSSPASDNLKLRVSSHHIERLLSLLVELAGNWVLFLGQLQLSRGKVEQIKRDTPNTDNYSPECLRAGLYVWVNSSDSATYEALCTALRSEVVGENYLAEKVEAYAMRLDVPEETKSTFSVEMSYDSMYQWLLQNGVDEEDCQLLKDKKVNGKVFSKIKKDHLEKLGVSFGSLILLEELINEVSMITVDNQPTINSDSHLQTKPSFPNLAASDPKPSMPLLQLLKWKKDDGSLIRLRIMRDSSMTWNSIGTALAISNAELAGYKKRHMEDSNDCIREVYSRWLENGGQLANSRTYPVSWKGLYNLLLDCELQELAERLCEALRAPYSSFKKNL